MLGCRSTLAVTVTVVGGAGVGGLGVLRSTGDRLAGQEVEGGLGVGDLADRLGAADIQGVGVRAHTELAGDRPDGGIKASASAASVSMSMCVVPASEVSS